MLDRLIALQERGRLLINNGREAAALIASDEDLKKEIDALYRHFYHLAISGCRNCYVDALIELCHLKKETVMKKTDKFTVSRGKVLKDTVNNDARLNLVRGNETDELALYHLYTNPNSIPFFETLPDDILLKDMLAEYGKKYEAERNAKFGEGVGNTEADKIINDAKQAAERILEDAKVEAGMILEDAKVEAGMILEDAKVFGAAKQTKKKSSVKIENDPIME